jgi:hypothetical protein
MLGYIDFPLPEAIALQYNVDPKLVHVFVGDPSYVLRLYPKVDGYKPFPDQTYEATKGFTNNFASVVVNDRGFDAQFMEQEDRIADCLEDLLEYTRQIGRFAKITCYDTNVRRNSTERAAGYATRRGRFTLERQGGVVLAQGSLVGMRYNSGISIQFREF